MPAAEDHPDPYGQDRYDELMRLNARLDDLVEAHHAAADPAVQADVAAQLRSIRQRIADLTRVEQRTWDEYEAGVDDPYGLAPPAPFNEHDPFNDGLPVAQQRAVENGYRTAGHDVGGRSYGSTNGNGAASGNGAVSGNGAADHNLTVDLASHRSPDGYHPDIGTDEPLANGSPYERHPGGLGNDPANAERHPGGLGNDPDNAEGHPGGLGNDPANAEGHGYGANRAVFYEADEPGAHDDGRTSNPNDGPAGTVDQSTSAFGTDFPPPDPRQLRQDTNPAGTQRPIPSPFDDPADSDLAHNGYRGQQPAEASLGDAHNGRVDDHQFGPGPVPSALEDAADAEWDERFGPTDADDYDFDVDGVSTIDPFPAGAVESFASPAGSFDEPDPFSDNFAPPTPSPTASPAMADGGAPMSEGSARDVGSRPTATAGQARVDRGHGSARAAGPGQSRRPGDGAGGRGLGGDSISLDNLPRPLIAAVMVSLALLALVGLNALRGSDETAEPIQADGIAPAAPDELEAVVVDIRGVLGGMGLGGVSVEPGEGTILLGGTAASPSERDSAVGAATALAGQIPVDAGNLTVQGATPASTETTAAPATPAAAPGGEAMQREINRILASTPIIFETGQVDLTERHRRILNAIVSTMNAYPGTPVKIIGYTDGVGSDAANQQLSQARAQGVKDYLVGQGVPADSLQVEALGEQSSTGSDALALLERRVEFEVAGTAPAAAAGAEPLKVAVIAPSARNDLAFTQSMVDAVNLVGEERPLEIAVTDSTFVPEEAAAAIRNYAEQNYDLVIAHGSQFGASLVEIAPQYPDVVFAWGTASDTFGLPNVYAYDAASQEGGYVLGALAASVSQSGVIGVVGPIEVGDAARYVNGFQAGAQAERSGVDVAVTYTGSFSDIGLASEAATAHADAGADVMTGSAQMVVGAVNVAAERGALWFGTQADQTSLAPGIVVASQVYRWEVVLRSILTDIDRGAPAGRTYSIGLANGGIAIEYNPDFAVPAQTRDRADQISAAIIDGSIVPPG